MELRIFPLFASIIRSFRASPAITITGALGLVSSAHAEVYRGWWLPPMHRYFNRCLHRQPAKYNHNATFMLLGKETTVLPPGPKPSRTQTFKKPETAKLKK